MNNVDRGRSLLSTTSLRGSLFTEINGQGVCSFGAEKRNINNTKIGETSNNQLEYYFSELIRQNKEHKEKCEEILAQHLAAKRKTEQKYLPKKLELRRAKIHPAKVDLLPHNKTGKPITFNKINRNSNSAIFRACHKYPDEKLKLPLFEEYKESIESRETMMPIVLDTGYTSYTHKKFAKLGQNGQKISSLSLEDQIGIIRQAQLTQLPRNYYKEPTNPIPKDVTEALEKVAKKLGMKLVTGQILSDPKTGMHATVTYDGPSKEGGEKGKVYLTFQQLGWTTKGGRVKSAITNFKQYVGISRNLINGLRFLVPLNNKIGGVPAIYLKAAQVTKEFGEELCMLNEKNYSNQIELHLIGFSLGAGLAEYATARNDKLINSTTIFQPAHIRGIAAQKLHKNIKAQEKIFCVEVGKDIDYTLKGCALVSPEPKYTSMNFIEYDAPDFIKKHRSRIDTHCFHKYLLWHYLNEMSTVLCTGLRGQNSAQEV